MSNIPTLTEARMAGHPPGRRVPPAQRAAIPVAQVTIYRGVLGADHFDDVTDVHVDDLGSLVVDGIVDFNGEPKGFTLAIFAPGSWTSVRLSNHRNYEFVEEPK